ncbi:MAG: hypothetical protein KAI33_03490 [Elusimicrobiales bacterium]|nr:hypothetical protein [Elusimicrobiales bacterium]
MLKLFKPTIKRILTDLAKITDIKTLPKTADIKQITLKLSENIDTLSNKLNSKKNTAEYLKIIKGLRDLNTLLDNISFEIFFHKIQANEILKILLPNLKESLTILANCAASNKKSDLTQIKQIVAENLKEIKLAKLAISNENGNFMDNLKFSSIYDRVEFCFLAADDIADALGSEKELP